jgi:hypothetical protein
VNGTHGHEVVFQGDRLEPDYKDLPGQWDRIWINENKHNVINYAIIKNGFIGIQAGNSVLEGLGGNTITATPTGTLSLSNTIIQNCSYAGIIAKYFNVTGGNNVVSNCGKYLCALLYGGNYSFTQCTFANYWNQTNQSSSGSQTRTTPSFLFNNYSGTTAIQFDSLYFANCILDGNLDEEFQYDTIAGGFNHPGWYKFGYSLMKTQMDIYSIPNIFPGCVKSTSSSNPSSFVNTTTYNFHLNSNSAALGTGTLSLIGQWANDIEGNSRTSGNPDMGAYQH